ncbi:hypothetical protein FQN54_004951 [Arachnomyces sp. PD_36]|nr:hypothetical protein FQN54_004951 [Arachnomyces sp. PD_36]
MAPGIQIQTTQEITSPKYSVKLHAIPPKEVDDSDLESEDDYLPLPPISKEPTEILELDKNTPDSHVPRDSRLIRLTGVHPFNVEAPLTALYDEGFLTSPELFYVRNHGPVPRVRDEEIPTWELKIEGLVENPIVLNFRQILEDFEQITAPVTLVCAGNRRKEQNVVRKTKGFSWGPAGLSTALFTGPLMASVLRAAKPIRGRAKYVCMEGADKLPNGYYGTSLKLNWVMDPNRGIMLAHKMNGESLRPDHGRPLRAVVPGQIGGRSVKWLTKLIVTDAPSENWYHIYDNRVLPTMVSPEISASEPKWWYDERYAIYDLSVNSAAAYPQHNETLQISSSQPDYKARGYAYSGGGRQVTRVEVSVDSGRTWRLANIEYPEDKYRNIEKNFIPLSDLVNTDSLIVRAMDESMSIQPRDMYWSVLGMMNNPWFRVAITKEDDCLKFEHPTHPTIQTKGWMERVKDLGGDLLNGNWGQRTVNDVPVTSKTVEVSMRKDGLEKEITLDEFKMNSSAERPWFVVKGEVYDGTGFLEDHPGGSQSIVTAAGMDVTDDFLAIHSETATAMMKDYHIGTLDKASQETLKNNIQEEQPMEATRSVFLQPRSWAKATLCHKETVSWDTRLFTFKLDHDSQTLGLPVGQHILTRLASDTNDTIIRSYTPISEVGEKGTVTLLVKVYFPTVSSPGGKMSLAMDKLSLGSTIDFKGPIGKFEYQGKGKALVRGIQRQIQSFRMICGGSGITPIFQVLRAVAQDADDPTSCTVLDSNRQEEDILCRSELDELVGKSGGRCEVVHTLTQPPTSWPWRTGRISETMLREYCSVPGGDNSESLVLVCGPKALEEFVHGVLLEQGWKESDLVFF